MLKNAILTAKESYKWTWKNKKILLKRYILFFGLLTVYNLIFLTFNLQGNYIFYTNCIFYIIGIFLVSVMMVQIHESILITKDSGNFSIFPKVKRLHFKYLFVWLFLYASEKISEKILNFDLLSTDNYFVTQERITVEWIELFNVFFQVLLSLGVFYLLIKLYFYLPGMVINKKLKYCYNLSENKFFYVTLSLILFLSPAIILLAISIGIAHVLISNFSLIITFTLLIYVIAFMLNNIFFSIIFKKLLKEKN